MPANQYLDINTATGNPKRNTPVVASGGVGDANKIVATDATGHLDPTILPPGLTVPTRPIVASEALAAGDLVNIWLNGGVSNVRKADASTTGKQADGFVDAAVLITAVATVKFPGDENTAVTGLTIGPQWLSDTVPGKCMATPPTTAGHVIQRVGDADTATNLIFQPGAVYEL